MNEQLHVVLQNFAVTLLTGVLTVVSGFLIALVKKGVDWVSEKVETVKNDRLRKDALDAIDKLETIVTTTVTSLQQTLGDDIKESLYNNDGKYTKEDLLALKDKAVSSVRRQLPEASTKLLNTLYSDLHKMIEDLVESAVRNLKFTESQGVLTALPEVISADVSDTKKILNE